MIILSKDKSKLFYFGVGCTICINPQEDTIVAFAPGSREYVLLGGYKTLSGMNRIIEDIMTCTMSDSFYYMPKEEEDVIEQI